MVTNYNMPSGSAMGNQQKRQAQDRVTPWKTGLKGNLPEIQMFEQDCNLAT